MCRSRRELSNEYLLAKIGVIEPQNPADERDDAVAGEVDTIAERQPVAHGIPSFPSAPPGSRARKGRAKTKANKQKKPRNGEER